MRIHIKTGREGPRHDPYGYEEITVHRADGAHVTLHEGFGTWIEFKDARGMGNKLDELNSAHRSVQAALYQLILDRALGDAGISVEAARKAYRTLRSRCRNCGGRETCFAHGYPGESFELCVQCGHVVDSHFDLSAVE
jgi:hypothetical protein